MLTLTIIQSDLSWEERKKNLEMFAGKISSCGETDLIILPEMFSTGFTMNASAMFDTMDGETIEWMSNQSKKKKCVIAGSIIIKEDNNYFNRLIWMTPDGFQYYDKRHLFSFANEDQTYKQGNKKIITEIKGWKILPLVCYDLRFPAWSRRTKKEDYDLLIYVANWPEKRVYAWKQLLIARAIENQCYVAGVNRVGNDGNKFFHSGESAVIDFKGEMMNSGKAGDEFISTATLSKEALMQFRNQFAFFEDGDEFQLKG